MYNPEALKIYIDGSAPEGNPGGPGGIGLIIEFPDGQNKTRREIRKGFKQSTNNRMELRAFLEALDYLKGETQVEAIILTDSQYVYDGQYDVLTWQKNKWTTQAGTPTANRGNRCQVPFFSLNSLL